MRHGLHFSANENFHFWFARFQYGNAFSQANEDGIVKCRTDMLNRFI